jgi:hypothetical protein
MVLFGANEFSAEATGRGKCAFGGADVAVTASTTTPEAVRHDFQRRDALAMWLDVGLCWFSATKRIRFYGIPESYVPK